MRIDFGELVKQIDAMGKTDSLSYDVLGRVATRIRDDGTTTYSYDPSGKPGLLSSVTYPGGSVSFNYDTYGRLQNKTIVINSTNLTTSYTYDSYSRMQTQTYPSGFAIKNIYNTFGYLEQVRRNDNNALIWECELVNVFGGVTRQKYGNNLTTVKDYDIIGMLRGITTGNVQDLEYSFSHETGNLIARRDNIRELTELFGYDDLGRLTGVSGPAPMALSYASNGNIQSKSMVGSYTYGTKPHAVASVSNPNGLIPAEEQRITYTSFNKTDSIIQAAYLNVFTYGHQDQRTISRYYENEVLKKTTYFAGDYEVEMRPGQQARRLHYISGGDGLAAIYVKYTSIDTMYYVHTDHLGSFNVITNQSGSALQYYSFDAWGRRRNHADWTYTNVPSAFLFARGFTGHEHLDVFALINMNGRMYDPLLGRFLAPDNFVQAPDFSQSFNRYSYCLNNPLIFSDPSGDWWQYVVFGVWWYLNTAHKNHDKETGKWAWNPRKWVEKDKPGFEAGVITNSSFSSVTVYGGVNLGGLSVPAIAYSTNHGFGFGNAGNPGYNEFIYPSVNYNAPEENAIKGIQAGINNYISSNIVNGPFIDISLTEALFWLVNISKMKQIEILMYQSDYGYFYERTMGFSKYLPYQYISDFNDEKKKIGLSLYDDKNWPIIIVKKPTP